MDQELYEKAKRNILKCKDQEYLEEIQCEYDALVYESKLIKADEITYAHIKELQQIVKKFGYNSMADCRQVYYLREALDRIVKSGKYYPGSLEKIELAVEKRLKRK